MSESKTGVRVLVIRDDGREIDVTQEVATTYDLIRQSLDWGSGFLDREEVDAVARLSEACNYPDFDELVRELWIERVVEGYRASAWVEAIPEDQRAAAIASIHPERTITEPTP